MINLKNTLVLAGTKLKTRKIRLIVTVVISSLMFGVLTAGVITFTGFTNSIERFSNEGLNNRFFVEMRQFQDGFAYVNYYEYFAKPEAHVRAKEIANEMVEERAKRAKELGLEFDKKLELARLLPESLTETDHTGKEVRRIDPESMVGKRIEAEQKQAQKPDPNRELSQANIERTTAGYGVVGKFQKQSFSSKTGSFSLPDKTGEYSFDASSSNRFKASPDEPQYQPIAQVMSVPDSIVAPFRLPKTKWSVESKTIPIFISFSEARVLLDIKSVPGEEPAQDRLRRQAEIQDKITGFKIKECYLNNLALEQLQLAKQHEVNKKTKDYVSPELIYGLPENGACAVASVISDKRSAETKKHDSAQHQFNVEFNQRDAQPVARELTFEVVGVIPSTEDVWTGSLPSRLVGIAIGSPGLSQAVAETDFLAAIKHLDLTNIFKKNDPAGFAFVSSDSWFVELATLEDANRLINERDCVGHFFRNNPNSDVSISCDADHPFTIYPALNNRLQLKSMIDNFFKVILIVLAGVVTIATIIMAATVGRMIADSRRETAVFRAIGFKRWDIARVYGIYTFIICLFVVVASFGIGYIGARVVAGQLDQDLTTQAILSTGTANHDLTMTLIGFSPLYLGVLVGAILLVGLLAIIFPLIRNLRRNPIKDMRDE